MASLLFQAVTNDAPPVHELNGGRVSIGRSADNTIVLDDASISSHHAEIHPRDGSWLVRDLQSCNGTMRNGNPLEEGLLQSGDIIRFGVIECQFINPDAEDRRERSRGPTGSKAVSSGFSWWPTRRMGKIALSILLVGQFVVSSGGGWFSALYGTGLSFFVYTIIRYAFAWRGGKLRPMGDAPWWKNAGVVAILGLAVWFTVLRPSNFVNEADALRNRFTVAMNVERQSLFNWVHPVGNAKQVVVHQVTVGGGPTGPQAEVRFTIYWEGPVRKDGFTKVNGIFDFESGRFVRGKILETNGTTNTQVLEGLGEFVGVLLDHY